MIAAASPLRRNRWSPLWRILRLRRRQVWLVGALTLLVYGLSLGLPVFLQLALDKAVPARDLPLLLLLLAGAGAAVLADAFAQNLRQKTIIELGSFFERRFSLKNFAHLLSRRPRAAETRGEILARFQEASKLRNFILEAAPQALFEIGGALAALALAFWYSWIVGLLLLVASLGSALWLHAGFRRFSGVSGAYFAAEGQRQGLLAETVDGLLTIKLQALEMERLARWREAMDQRLAALRRVDEASRRMRLGGELIQQGVTALVFGASCLLLFQDSLTLGELLALQMLVGRVSGPISGGGYLIRQFQEIDVALKAFARLQEEPREQARRPEAASPDPAEDPGEGVAAEDLSVSYAPDRPPALAGVSFSLPSKGLIAVVGRNGSGKSTLVNALLGLHPQAEGRIRIHGRPLEVWPPRRLRASMGVAGQEAGFFSGPLRAAVSGGRDLPEARIWAALDFAQARGFVEALPDGLDHRLEARGGDLSGGQRQRLAIARAVIREPRIAIFDEPGAFLDAEAALALERRLLDWGRERLLILVTHDLASARAADRILVLDQGRLAGFGRHEELLAACPPYADLWEDYARRRE